MPPTRPPKFRYAVIGNNPSKKQIIKAAIAAARLGGCTCDPSVKLTAQSGTGAYSVGVAHDEWCKHPRDSQATVDALDHAVLSLGPKQ